MFDFSTRTSFTILSQTKGFILFRMAVYFGIAVAWILATGTGAGAGWTVGLFGDEDFRISSTFWGGGLAFAIAGGALFFFRDYLLYMVKAAHIALMVEFLEGRDIPRGRDQVSFAQNLVKERFKEASFLFALDALISGVIRMITGLVEGILSLFQLPYLDRIAGVVRGFLKVAVGMVDEVILAEIIRRKTDNPFSVAKQSLVLYAQNAAPIMKNAALITLLGWILAFVVFLIALVPAGLFVWLLPGKMTAATFVFAVIFAWAAKVALIEPFILASVLQVYYRVTEGQKPNPEWEAKLDKVSDKFRELGSKAAGWVTGGRAKAAAAEPEPST